ncbi:FtsX-like permease family protein [Curtobacterium sp. MCBA15_008]|uniref:FtsX-like permease family protein n=1 Tax=Curtobacterium sp. MCBA15_008 TaxID=1898736 RepID=UPI0008DE3F5E|nr:FtsX-like permease family protein [Curtobacterium sp. MCBA15_008]OII06913.1 hypothetical protein BIU96_04885 [Curtobacterium sp. MCBA15_008]
MATGIHTSGIRGLALFSIAGTVLAFTVVAVLVVLTSVMGLTVSLLRRTYALWQIVGVTPRAVTVAVLVQLIVVAVSGAVVGAVAGGLVAPAVVQRLLQDATGLETLRVSDSLTAVAVVAILTVGVALVGGLGAARRAGRTPAVLVLRDASAGRRRRPVRRAVTALLLLALAAQMLTTLPTSLDSGAAQAVLIGPVLVATVAVLGRIVSTPVLHSWTAMVPGRFVAFWLAQATVRWSVARSDGALAALLVAIGLPAALVAGQQTVGTVLGGATARSGGTLLILGGPVLLAAVGAAAISFMASRDREREQALLSQVGGTPALQVIVAVFEGLVLVLTAFLLAVLAVAVTVTAEWALLVGAHPQARPVWAIGTLLSGAAITGPLMVAATLFPMLSVRRRSTHARSR